jgi:hypothetical protein
MYNAQIPNDPPTGKWTTGLFDCCEDSENCKPFYELYICHVPQNYELLHFCNLLYFY